MRNSVKERSHDTMRRRRKSLSVVLKMHDYKIVRVWRRALMRYSDKTTDNLPSKVVPPK